MEAVRLGGVTYVVIDAAVDLDRHAGFDLDSGYSNADEALRSLRPGLVYRFDVAQNGSWSNPKVLGVTHGMLVRGLH